MKHYMREERTAKPWRSQVVLGVLALVVLAVGTFFFVQALGGFEKVIALLGQGQALGRGMRDLVEQSTDNVNKMGSSVRALEQTLQRQQTESGTNLGELSTQIQGLHDSIDELKVRLANVTQKLEAMEAARQEIPSTTATGAPPPQAPPADVLYNNALRDYNAGRYDVAMQNFQDYLKFYPTEDMAGNAQFYVGDIYYRQGQFQQAVQEYDKVLERHAGGNKNPAAQLKKAYALIELNQRDAAVRELNSLIARYPRSQEATQARDRLRRLRTAPAQSRQR